MEERKVILAQYYCFLTIQEGVEDLLDNNIGEIDHIITSMEIKKEYILYFIKFKEINGTQTIAILNNQSTQYAITGEDIFKALLLQLLKTSVFIFKD